MIPNLIYDVGMNNGDDTAYYLHRGFRVIAIEANPELVAQARVRFARAIADGRLVIVNAGITAAEEQMPFWVCETHSEWCSFDRDIASRDGCPHHSIAVACLPFRTILAEHGVPYYLKVDIEGNDALCLHDLGNGALPKYISVEASDLRLLGMLKDLGYRHFKGISQFNYLPMQEPPTFNQRLHEIVRGIRTNPNWWERLLIRVRGRCWLEERVNKAWVFDDWQFPAGSSGPFGPDLPGRWQSYQELCDVYQRLAERQRVGEPSLFWNEAGYSFWSDFHARR